MPVKYLCNNNADLRDCGDSHSDSCNKELQINYIEVIVLMTETALEAFAVLQIKNRLLQ